MRAKAYIVEIATGAVVSKHRTYDTAAGAFKRANRDRDRYFVVDLDYSWYVQGSKIEEFRRKLARETLQRERDR